jgi:hypothetical protein
MSQDSPIALHAHQAVAQAGRVSRCVATSAGAAPILSMIDADWRSMARRSDCGKDCRVASRSKSCRTSVNDLGAHESLALP